MRLRPARPEDIATLARIAVDSYRKTFAGILERRALDARDASFFIRRFRRTRRRLHLASTRGRVVAFSMVTRKHLDMLFVDPRFMGRGAGRRLLARCTQHGVCTLECFRDNHAARRFYERQGWRLVRSYARVFAGKSRDFVFYERRPATLDLARRAAR